MFRYIVLLSCFVAFLVVIRTSVVNISWIASGSMLPGFAVQDWVVMNQLAWGLNVPFVHAQLWQWRTPERGDVVLFRNPHDEQHIWMKRVIALPGDTVEFTHQQLYINHYACEFDSRRYESLPRRDGMQPQRHRIWFSWWEDDWGPHIVPPGEVFLMGDNRGASDDSRSWGAIPLTQLSGAPWIKLWPLDQFGVRVP